MRFENNAGREHFSYSDECDLIAPPARALAGAQNPLFHLLETLLEHDSIMSVRTAVESFLAGAAEPCVVEPGYDPLPLIPGQWEIAEAGRALLLQAWSRETNLVRRVVALGAARPGELELAIERFGRRGGTLRLIDRAHGKAAAATRRAGRLVFREWLRRALSRHFAGWRLGEISAEADLEHSLSPAYVRAFVTRGAAGWAVMGAAPDCGDVPGALAFGLIWLDYLRRREHKVSVEGLALFLPEGQERSTCLRLRWLDARAAAYAVYVYGGEGWEQKVDLADAGNLDSELPVYDAPVPPPVWMEPVSAMAGVECLPLSHGEVSWRVRGLEFARWDGRIVRFGIDGRRPASEARAGELAALARHLAAVRSAGPSNRNNPLWTRAPERWLESVIRGSLSDIDASLLEAPVYGQVPSFAGAGRGVIDLLACGVDGRLCVIEVKASEDPQLPLQALDYWMRVRWHASRQEFRPRGYFPGIPVSESAPRMLLVAPALCFHSSTETVLRFLAPEVEVTSIGVAANWRSGLKVVFRRTRCDDRS